MKTHLLFAIINLITPIIHQVASPANSSIKEAEDALKKSDKAKELLPTASSEIARAALSFTVIEREEAALVALGLARQANDADQERAHKAARDAAENLKVYLQGELDEFSNPSPEVTSDILLDIGKLELIAEENDGPAAMQIAVEVLQSALKRAARI
jgi:hypothetical protein